MKSIRIGSGAGYAGDRIEPAIDVLKNGNVDYMIFECLAERTIALANQEKEKDPSKGYNHLLEYRFEEILKAYKEGNHVKIVTNMGAANPQGAALKVLEMAEAKGVSLRIGVVLGDDVTDKLESFLGYDIIEFNQQVKDLKEIISANAYIGSEGITELLGQDVDVVITGRVADPSLVLGILMHEFKWDEDDHDHKAQGTMAGHILECGAQVSGGYYLDGYSKFVDNPWDLGFPIVDFQENGDFIVTKTSTSAGVVNEMTCKEQCLYEVQDPHNYYTPDCTVDLSQITMKEIDKDKVLVSNIKGKPSNGKLKVSIAYKEGFIGEGQISYGGKGALKRAQIASEIIDHRLKNSNVFMIDKKN